MLLHTTRDLTRAQDTSTLFAALGYAPDAQPFGTGTTVVARWKGFKVVAIDADDPRDAVRSLRPVAGRQLPSGPRSGGSSAHRDCLGRSQTRRSWCKPGVCRSTRRSAAHSAATSGAVSTEALLQRTYPCTPSSGVAGHGDRGRTLLLVIPTRAGPDGGQPGPCCNSPRPEAGSAAAAHTSIVSLLRTSQRLAGWQIRLPAGAAR